MANSRKATFPYFEGREISTTTPHPSNQVHQGNQWRCSVRWWRQLFPCGICTSSSTEAGLGYLGGQAEITLHHPQYRPQFEQQINWPLLGTLHKAQCWLHSSASVLPLTFQLWRLLPEMIPKMRQACSPSSKENKSFQTFASSGIYV